MKILNTVYGDATGGRWKAMLNIADTLESYGHEVVLLRGEENAHLSSEGRPIHIIANTGFYSPLAALKVREFLQQQQPDIIIAHSGKAVWLFKNAMMGMKKKIPVIAVNHSHNVKRTIRADAFINITPHMQDLVTSLLPEKDKKLKHQKVISNLIHLPEEVALPQLIREPATVAMFTRMTENKGVHVLIESIYLLSQKGIRVNTILAGEGESKAKYQKMVKDYALEDLVSFPGWINGQEKIDLYHQADMVAIPSLYDIQPLGILDAFGWGKVVLSSDDIGPRQICKHKVNSWVAKAGDAQDLADGIEYLITHKPEALKYAQQAKKEALDIYCFEKIAQQHNDFVNEVFEYYN